jgi:gas vesicle protein
MKSDAGMTHRTKIGLAFVVGGMVAAGVTLLCAPEEGSQARGRVRGYLGGAWDRTRDALGTVANQGRGIVSGSVAPINAAYRAGREAYRSESTRLRDATRQSDSVSDADSRRLPM